MSLYTEQKKKKSLWHPITDENFDIDFSMPFIVCTEEVSLFIVDSLQDLFENYMDQEQFFDFKAQTLSEEGKEYFRDNYYGYMYLDEEFYKAIDWAKGKYIEDVKGERERPLLFAMDEYGPKVFDHFGFDINGIPIYEGTPEMSKEFAIEYPDLYHVEYIVNLNQVSETDISALFRAPIDKPKTAYVVTSGEYSDYRVDGVFSDKEKAELFVRKTEDRTIEVYNIDDEEQLREENWYEIKIYISKSSKVKNVFVNDLCQSGKYFDAVRFKASEDSINLFFFYLQAIDRDKAKAIALERFHALLAVESSHFPMLRWTRDINYGYGISDFQEGLVFGYFDYKAYFYSSARMERIQDLFMNIKDSLPVPLTEEEKAHIDWQNLTEDVCLQLMNSHGLKIELKKDLPVEFI